MAKTKLDRALELLEAQAAQMAKMSNNNNTGAEVSQQQVVEDVQAPEMNIAPESDTGDQQEYADVNTDVQSDINNLPQETGESQSGSDDFERSFNELVGMFENPNEQTEQQENDASESEVQLSEEQESYKKLYEQEMEKRIALEGEARQSAIEVNYLKNMLEKEGDKYYSNIDKQRELEAQLRSANASKMPEQIAPLGQSYMLWQETNTPAHKWRAVKDALTLVENMTGVSADEYYSNILRSENKDIPGNNERSSITDTVELKDKKNFGGFML